MKVMFGGECIMNKDLVKRIIVEYGGYFDGGEGIHCWGSNKFPKNFNAFLKVMEMKR